MSRPARKAATYDELCALPAGVVGEIVNGELVASPRPTIRHAVSATELLGGLNNPFRYGKGGPGGWRFLIEPELHFGSDVLVPDLAGWRREHLPSLPANAFLEAPPDWVCEVLSEATARLDRIRKLPRYGEVGVQHAWLIEPAAQTLEGFRRLDDGSYKLALTAEGEAVVRAEPFDAIELELRVLWELST